MNVTVYCSTCLKPARFDAGAAPERIVCRRCGGERPIEFSAAHREGMVERCAVCGCGHLYVEKDFNRWVGGIVLLAAVGGFLWAQSFSILLGFAILGGAALLDLFVYAVVPMRAVCYRCLAEHRGIRRNPTLKGYELGIAARFAEGDEGQQKRG